MDNVVTIMYRVVLTAIAKGLAPLYRFIPILNGTIRDDAVYAAVAKMSGQPKPLVKATLDMTFDMIVEYLKLGYRVEFPQMSAFLSIPGTVESTSAESLKAANPVLVAHLAAKGDFRKCCQGPGFTLKNATLGASVGVDTVLDDVNGTPNVIRNGVNVEVHATGRGLYMPETDDPAVGAYIADGKGTVLVKANIVETMSTMLVCVFPDLNLPEGAYKFCVASRNGLDPAQYGVTVGSKNIQVINATSEEEEEEANG